MNRKQTIAEAIEKYRNCEMSPADIAEKYNVSSTVLRHHVSTEERMNSKRDEIAKMINSFEMTTHQIAKHFHFSYRVFLKYLEDDGIRIAEHNDRVKKYKNQKTSSAKRAEMRRLWLQNNAVRRFNKKQKPKTIDDLSAVERLAMCGAWV